MALRPIETMYNGYRFRSRLEARWAVFFDTLHIEYEYEPEGYRLKSGKMYLPDFYLPEFNIFVEVKASYELDDGKAKEFALSGDLNICCGVLICYGQPSNDNLRFISPLEWDDGGAGEFDSYPDIDVHFAIRERSCYDKFSELCIFIAYQKTDAGFYGTKRVYAFDHAYANGYRIETDDYRIRMAMDNAKQARFEHGETPKTSAGYIDLDTIVW